MSYCAFEKSGCLITANGDFDNKIQPEGMPDYIAPLSLDFEADPFTTANVPVPLPRPEPKDVLPKSDEDDSDADIDIIGEEEENEDDEDRNIFSWIPCFSLVFF